MEGIVNLVRRKYSPTQNSESSHSDCIIYGIFFLSDIKLLSTDLIYKKN